MAYLSDIEIAQQCKMKHINEIAAKLDISDDYLEQYGKYKAKVDYKLLDDSKRKNGKLILVTAITPTSAGEGKTTTTIGLADGLTRIGKSCAVALREPSLGPVFGVKGGAAGGGYAQVAAPFVRTRRLSLYLRCLKIPFSVCLQVLYLPLSFSPRLPRSVSFRLSPLRAVLPTARQSRLLWVRT